MGRRDNPHVDAFFSLSGLNRALLYKSSESALQRRMQRMRLGVPLSPYTPCIGVIASVFKIEVNIEVDFFSLASASGRFCPAIP